MKKCKVQKLLASLLAASMVLGLTACGGSKEPSAETTNANEEVSEANEEVSEPADDTADEAEETGYVGPDWEALDAMSYDERSDALMIIIWANSMSIIR